MAYSCWLAFVFISARLTVAHIPSYDIPMRSWEWAEPENVIVVEHAANTQSKEQSLERLAALRSVLQEYEIDAYIIPTADAHNSQYIAPCDARREWLSGLTGSSGIALVTSSDALLWTDGRYFTQFFMEVNTTYWTLMRQGSDATMQQWLLANLRPGDVVGVDPTTYTRSSWTSLESALVQANISLRAVSENLVDIARDKFGDPAPARPNNDLMALTVNYTGKVSSEKITMLLQDMRQRQASVLVLTALDDVAYTLNLRGSDIPYNPVFFSYLVIRADVESPNNVILFWGDGQLTEEIEEHLTTEGTRLQVRPYEEVFNDLAKISTDLPDGSIIWLSQDGSHAIHLVAETNLAVFTVSTVSPVALMKCIKNSVELKGFRLAHIKDGIAVVRFWRWIHEKVDAGERVSEIDVSDKLAALRAEEDDFVGPSFATIAGAGENGAIIHYKPSRDGPQRYVLKDDILLVDSGGQYKDGTTDITRTRHMSASPTPAQRETFTRVLKGQILLGTAVFPAGITGNVLETLARKALWDVGLNYAHGTGHGVGHFLNVHEGPSGIGGSLIATDPGIIPGMIFSDEPGYYEEGHYGIRHEDLVEVIEMNKDADHLLAEGLVGDFDGRGAVAFYTISLAPHQTACLNVDILSDFEIKYINDYHARVLSTLGPILQSRNLVEDYEWLEKECAPIHRSAAILLTSAPFLVVLSVLMWVGVQM